MAHDPENFKLMPVPVAQAARALGIGESTLRAYIRAGAPVAHRGGRGRGRMTLVDVAAVRAWKRGGDADALRGFAARVPELVAASIYDAHRNIDGPHKCATISELPGLWYSVTCALLDEIRRDIPDIADPDQPPEKIVKLLAILRGSG